MSQGKATPTCDPSGRFEKLDEPLVVHSNVICFKAYDKENGLEVSWYEIDCKQLTDELKDKLESRASIVKTFKISPLLSVFTYWFDEEKTKFYLVTENVNNKSIFSHLKVDDQSYRPKAIQKWATAVLQALDFLHSRSPPFIHFRVELASVFIKPSSKLVKLMPPLLNPYLLKSGSHDLKLRYNTSPEALENNVMPACDIWAFGIAVLFSVTKEMPYSECTSAFMLISRLRKFIPPDSLNRVEDPLLKDFISSCLRPTNERLTASDLMKHPFLFQSYEKQADPTPENFEILIEQKQVSSSTETIGSSNKIQLF
jgi:WNK lysine deficient protein kinase